MNVDNSSDVNVSDECGMMNDENGDKHDNGVTTFVVNRRAYRPTAKPDEWRTVRSLS